MNTNNYSGASTTTMTTTTATSNDIRSAKAVLVTPYCNTNNAIVSTTRCPNDASNKEQNNTNSRSADIEMNLPPTSLLTSSPSRSMESIANSSEIASWNGYNNLNEIPKRLFFGSDLVRNPDGE